MKSRARHKLWHPDIVRQRIRVSKILNRLRDHALGNIKMTLSEVRAAEVLLRKALPDLKAVEHSGEIKHTMSDAELDRRITELTAEVGAAVAARGEKKTH